jgi:hypothetical protein
MSREVVTPERALVEVLGEIRDALERIADAVEPKPAAPARPLTQHHIDWVGGGVGVCRDPACGCRDTTLPIR